MSPTPSYRLASWALLLLTVALLLVCVWIVLPAPNRLLLPLGVGAPELSPGLAILALLLLVPALVLWRMPSIRSRRALVESARPSGRVAGMASVAAALSLALALVPIAQFVGTAAAAERELANASARAGTAPERSDGRPVHGARTSMFSLRDMIRGIPHDSVRVRRHIPFSVAADDSLFVDVYEPLSPATQSYPTLVQVYGGAWQRGSPSDFSAFAEYLASHGWVVFAVDYRHAPRHRFPAQVDDMAAASAWIGAHAAEYHADTARVVWLGRSSGAQLAMLAGYADTLRRPLGVVSLYGPVDLAEGYAHPPRPDPLQVRGVEEAFLGGSPAEQPGRYRDASPITYAGRMQPPTLLLYGGRDHIVEARFGRQLRDTLRAHGTSVVHVELPWAEHAFDAVPGLGGQLSLYVIERFINDLNARALHAGARNARTASRVQSGHR